MPAKTIRLPVTVGVEDPGQSTPEMRDDVGRLIQAGVLAVRYVPPGTPVTLDEEEADRLLARFGPYTELEIGRPA